MGTRPSKTPHNNPTPSKTSTHNNPTHTGASVTPPLPESTDLDSTSFANIIFGPSISLSKQDFIKLVTQKFDGTEQEVNLIIEKAGLESKDDGKINKINCEKLFDGWFSPIHIKGVSYKNTVISYKNQNISYKNTIQHLSVPMNSIPYIASLLSKPWFVAFTDGHIAEKQLSSTVPGTFVIRFSSTKGAYALSMKENTGQIGHWKIAKNDKFVIEGNLFDSLDELIEKYSKIPLVNTTTLINLPNDMLQNQSNLSNDTPQNQSNLSNDTPQNQSNLSNDTPQNRIVSDDPPFIPNKLHKLNGWVSKTNYKSLLVKDENSDYHPEVMEYIMMFLNSMTNFHNFIVQKCYLIHNENLLISHKTYFQSLKERWRSSPDLFYSDSWTKDGDGRRKQFLSNLEDHRSRFDWNPEKITAQSTPVIVPMLQGTSPEAAWKICSSGFATVATLDAGYYGKGIYFTSCTDYANYYSKSSYFVLALVIPGNVYPVTEEPENVSQIPSGELSKMTGEELMTKSKASLFGKPCQQGYQSHYVCVFPQGYQKLGRPLETWSRGAPFGDELVVFQDAQALPICVLNMKRVL